MTLQEHIDEIMDSFDFDTVHRVMAFLDWKWKGTVPEIRDLRRSVRELIKDAWTAAQKHNADYCASCGGFCVNAQHFDDGEMSVTVSFVAAEFSTVDNHEDRTVITKY